MSESRVTASDLAKLERSTAEALTIVAGLLAEAVGSAELALHFWSALQAAQAFDPNPQRDRLLIPAMRLVAIKAKAAAPHAPALQAVFQAMDDLPDRH